jgi:hypothetical protein
MKHFQYHLENKTASVVQWLEFWLQTQRSGFESLCYQIHWEDVGLEWGPLSLVSTLEELTIWIFKYYLERNYRLCGLVVIVPGYRFRGPGLVSRRCQIFWLVGVERGPLSLVSTLEGVKGVICVAEKYCVSSKLRTEFLNII